MRNLNAVVLTMQNKANVAMQTITQKLTNKKAGDAGTLAAIILIVIVVGLLIIFKDSIGDWVDTITGRVTGALSKFKPTT